MVEQRLKCIEQPLCLPRFNVQHRPGVRVLLGMSGEVPDLAEGMELLRKV